MTKKTYTVQCIWGCGTGITLNRKPPAAGLGCGAGACTAKHNAAVAEADRQAAEQRTERRRAIRAGKLPRREVAVYGDWGMACQLAGAKAKKGK